MLAQMASPLTKGVLLAEFHDIVDKGDYRRLERFPTIPPLSQAKAILPFLDEPHRAPPAIDPVLDESLETMLGGAKTDRGELPPVVLDSPIEIRYGHFNDMALTKAQLDQSPALARVLTSLAVDNGSKVSLTDPATGKMSFLHTPGELFRALLAMGHRIELRREVTDANFLSLTRERTWSGRSGSIRACVCPTEVS